MKEKLHDVGVIVARFQVDELHPGQVNLVKQVREECREVLVFLGVPPTKSTVEDPLPYQARKKMVEDQFLGINVLYIKDQRYDIPWSKALDEQIRDHTSPGHDVMLYGSRDSFVDRYHGTFPTTSLDNEGFKMYSGTAVRHEASVGIDNNRSWRKGVIWATQNTYQSVWPTVDIAIFNEDGTKVLLGRKPGEKDLRFPGGFVQRFADVMVVQDCLEINAKREVREECGDIELGDIKYVGSCQMDDWRYGKSCRIMTSFFKAKKVFGRIQAGDDLEYLEWVEFDKIVLECKVIDTHQPLVRLLLEDAKHASAT